MSEIQFGPIRDVGRYPDRPIEVLKDLLSVHWKLALCATLGLAFFGFIFISDCSNGNVFFRDIRVLGEANVYRSPTENLLYVEGVTPDGILIDLKHQKVMLPDTPMTTPLFVQFDPLDDTGSGHLGTRSNTEWFPERYEVSIRGTVVTLYRPNESPVKIDLH